ncbi:hypothetical protein TELCIR_06698 [Teladorsagia circumcincta]|uniref:Uncharacterized protein n=1 Tax=Teladorsagia circumcincta TaxID=45464 RepID=A0A2G9UMD4_TELCI|nr:hypothetical protein TELCIR_06698 [Teladorsagia circumcincta]
MGSIKEAAQLISDKKIRVDLFNSMVLPALCYASETWAENKTSTMVMTRTLGVGADIAEHQPQGADKPQLAQYRYALMSGIRDAAGYAWEAKKRWAGHVVRGTQDR